MLAALHSVEPWSVDAWDPCPVNYTVRNFLDVTELPDGIADIASNTPYGKLAEKIIRHAIELVGPHGGKVAALLPHAWDTAKGRVDLFTEAPFRCKYVLTERISWENLPKTASPSSNHGWFVWDTTFAGSPTMGWL